jgi:hypothetical protein
MTATARLKQLFFIAAALALVGLGLVAAFAPASPARADEPSCVPKDAYTETINHPAETHTVHHDAVTETIHHPAVTETVPGVWANWAPNDTHGPQNYVPGYPVDNVGNGAPRGTWIVHEGGVPPGHEGPDGVYQQGAGNSPFFYRQAQKITVITPAHDEVVVIEEAYDEIVVDKEAWTETIKHPAVTCDDPGPDCEQDPTAQGCPPVDNGKKVVVCKYVGTPPGTLHHIIIVSESSLTNPANNTGYVAPPDGDSWTDAQGQTTEGSVAIRYATEGEQAKDVALSECPTEDGPETCPEDTDKFPAEIPEGETVESFCNEEPDPGPGTCPENTDKFPQEIPEGETAESFCNDDDEEEVCPEGTDNVDQVIPEGETEETFCNDDDVDPGPTCEEDPTQEGCDEDKPNNPGQPNSPSNGPTVKGAQASSPNAAPVPAGTSAGTPAARVPTAIAAGLGGSSEPAGNGGNLGLLGVAATMLGAALIGVSFRPRRGRNLTG